MLYSFASEIPNEIAYNLFKTAIGNLCTQDADPLKRRAGLKVLGNICDSDALCDPIKDDIELWTDLLVRSLQDTTQIVREAACEAIGDFADDVIPDFLDQHPKVMPVLLQSLTELIELAPQSEAYATIAERAIYALGEFATNMEEYEIKPYLTQCLTICLAYLNGPT